MREPPGAEFWQALIPGLRIYAASALLFLAMRPHEIASLPREMLQDKHRWKAAPLLHALVAHRAQGAVSVSELPTCQNKYCKRHPCALNLLARPGHRCGCAAVRSEVCVRLWGEGSQRRRF
eukprot:5427943-Alexandrium_andersonii.AAC.1